ncbi:MAG: PcfJ domain-containing protein [Alphaproteobacteria bacterium]|nr:PcfJ domain-containing protein [Alphaproteobacteria bacterium]
MAVSAHRAGRTLVVQRASARERQMLVVRLPEAPEPAARGLFVSQLRGAVPTGSSVRFPRWRVIADPLDAETAALCAFAAATGSRIKRGASARVGREHLNALLGTSGTDEDRDVEIPLLRDPGMAGAIGGLFEQDGAPRHSFWREYMEMQPGEIFRVHRSVAALAGTVPLAGAMMRDLEGMDMERAEAALSCVRHPGPAAVRWYASKGDGAAERRQAAEAYPLLAEMIATRTPLRDAVENRQPLQAAISKETGLAPAACRRIARLDTAIPHGAALDSMVEDEDALGVRRQRTHGVHGRITVDDTLGLLAQLDPAWTPDTNAAWEAFLTVTGSAVLPVAAQLGREPAELVRSSRGDWPAWFTTLAKSAGYDPDADPVDRIRLALAVTDAVEAAHALAQDVLIPLSLRTLAEHAVGMPAFAREAGILSTAVDAALDQVVGKSKNPTAALLAFGRTWISRIPALSLAAADFRATGDAGEGRWPGLLPEPLVHNGVVLTSLTSTEALIAEGKQLDHCVGSYAEDCEGAGCHILSVRGPQKQRTTLQIGRRGASWSIVQHRGVRNARPSQAHRDAANWLHDALCQGTITPPRAVEEYRETTRELADHTRAEITPWMAITHLRRPSAGPPQPVWEEWRHILGGSVARADDPGVLFRNGKVRDLVGVISPDGARRVAEAAERRREQRAVAAPAQQGGPAP